MAIPLIPAAVAGLAKLGIGTKLASALGAAKGLIGGAGASSATRMAGQALFGGMTKGQIAARLAPDAIFGGVAALQTPGDLGDKLIAGSASAIGGGLGGLALGRAASRFGDGASLAADFAGSIGGDMAGMAAGDALMRGKDKIMGGAGMTPYERMSADQQAQFAEQIRRQTLVGAGLVPGVRDQFMYENGLG